MLEQEIKDKEQVCGWGGGGGGGGGSDGNVYVCCVCEEDNVYSHNTAEQKVCTCSIVCCVHVVLYVVYM